ncbi:MAG: pyruvate formate lyase family protein, partial [Candidatus Promineifilaceae bacterium]
MNERITRLLESIKVDRYPLCIEKSRLMTESFRKTEGEPMILRRAMALAHMLDNITIFIEDDQLIAGNAASKPMGLEFDFYAGLWPQEEVDGLKQAGYDITVEEEAEIVRMNAYWKDYNPMSRMGRRSWRSWTAARR